MRQLKQTVREDGVRINKEGVANEVVFKPIPEGGAEKNT